MKTFWLPAADAMMTSAYARDWSENTEPEPGVGLPPTSTLFNRTSMFLRVSETAAADPLLTNCSVVFVSSVRVRIVILCVPCELANTAGWCYVVAKLMPSSATPIDVVTVPSAVMNNRPSVPSVAMK